MEQKKTPKQSFNRSKEIPKKKAYNIAAVSLSRLPSKISEGIKKQRELAKTYLNEAASGVKNVGTRKIREGLELGSKALKIGAEKIDQTSALWENASGKINREDNEKYISLKRIDTFFKDTEKNKGFIDEKNKLDPAFLTYLLDMYKSREQKMKDIERVYNPDEIQELKGDYKYYPESETDKLKCIIVKPAIIKGNK